MDLSEMPIGVLVEVVKHCRYKDLRSLSLTCQSFNDACHEPSMWRAWVRRDFPPKYTKKRCSYWMEFNETGSPVLEISKSTTEYVRTGIIEWAQGKSTYINLRMDIPRLHWKFNLRFKCPCAVCCIENGRTFTFHQDDWINIPKYLVGDKWSSLWGMARWTVLQ